MKKFSKLLLAFVIVTLTVSVLGYAEPKTSVPTKIRIGWQPGISPLFEVAAAQGWFEEEFKKENVSFEYVTFLSGPPLIEAFAGDRLDFGHVGDQPLIQARANDIDLKAIAVQTRGSKILGLVVPNGSPIKSLKDLKDKKVAVKVGSAAHHLLYLYLESVGLDIKDVKLVNLSPPEIKTALSTKDIDAAILWEPWISTVEYEKVGKAIFDSHGLKNNVSVVITSGEFIKKYPEATKRILKVYLRAAKWIKQNPKKAAEVISKNSGIKVPIIEKVLSRYEYDLRFDDEAVRSLTSTTKFLRENDLIRKDVNPKEFIEPKFLKKLGIQ